MIGDTFVGFASFHTGAAGTRAWSLDLMRYGPNLPDGAMQAIVHQAIIEARALGILSLSLGAVPESAFVCAANVRPKYVRWTQPLERLLHLGSGRGLHQFKDAFAPDWHNRYLCARHWPAVITAAAAIARAVRFPGALPQHANLAWKLPRRSNNRFALPFLIWHAQK